MQISPEMQASDKSRRPSAYLSWLREPLVHFLIVGFGPERSRHSPSHSVTSQSTAPRRTRSDGLPSSGIPNRDERSRQKPFDSAAEAMASSSDAETVTSYSLPTPSPTGWKL